MVVENETTCHLLSSSMTLLQLRSDPTATVILKGMFRTFLLGLLVTKKLMIIRDVKLLFANSTILNLGSLGASTGKTGNSRRFALILPNQGSWVANRSGGV